MENSTKRTYQSSARKQQADETKLRIAAAAYELLSKDGFAAMTIDAVARKAGFSAQSVYAIFGSKSGLLEAVIDRARFGESYKLLVEKSHQTEDPVQRLRFAAAIARQIYDAERGVLNLMGGAGVVSPDLATKMKDRELLRRDAQRVVIDTLDESGRLKQGLDKEAASDILWALTGRDLYRMLVQIQGWSADRYQDWLGELLVAELAYANLPDTSVDIPGRDSGIHLSE